MRENNVYFKEDFIMLESIIAYLSRVLAGLVTGIDATEWNSLNDFARYANAYESFRLFIYGFILSGLSIIAIALIVSIVKDYRKCKTLKSKEEPN